MSDKKPEPLFIKLSEAATTGEPQSVAAELGGYLKNSENPAYAMGASVFYGGTVVTTSDSGKIRAEGLGRDVEGTQDAKLAAIVGEKPFTRDDVFPIASITKSFVAAGMMHLQAEGKLSLDDNLKDNAEKWAQNLRTLYPDAPEEKLQAFRQLLTEKVDPNATIGDLLAHKSGLAGKGEENVRGPRVHVDFSKETTQVEGALGFLKPQPDMLVQPRGKEDYSNAGYVLSQLIMEASSGEKFRDVIETRIIQPLDLRQTRVTFAPNDVPNGAGCMVSTREDLLKYMSKIVGDMNTNPNSIYKAMKDQKIGLQVLDIEGKKWIGHTGGGGIAESVVLVDPENPQNGFATVKVIPYKEMVKVPSQEVQSGSIEASSPARAAAKGIK